jgi:hypothetical protein
VPFFAIVTKKGWFLWLQKSRTVKNMENYRAKLAPSNYCRKILEGIQFQTQKNARKTKYSRVRTARFE